jgi:AbrB family looped-hinge helix DNA binding protein
MPRKMLSKDIREEVLGVGKITAKGQITVPIDAREEFSFSLGDRLLFIKRGRELLVRKSK